MRFRTEFAVAALVALGVASVASAQAGRWDRWDGPGWGNSRWDSPSSPPQPGHDDREGKVDVASFVAPGAAAALLGHGTLAVELAPEAAAGDLPAAPYEAAVVDQMVHKGYDTSGPAGAAAVFGVTLMVQQDTRPPLQAGDPASSVLNRVEYGDRS